MDESIGLMEPDVARYKISQCLIHVASGKSDPRTHASGHSILQAYQIGNSRFPPILTQEKYTSTSYTPRILFFAAGRRCLVRYQLSSVTKLQ